MTMHMVANLSDSEFEELKTSVKTLLHNNKSLLVTFTKVDGSERVMRCTLNETVIPSDMIPKGTGGSVTTEVQRVFDLDENGWRSFKWDSVIQIEYDEVNNVLG